MPFIFDNVLNRDIFEQEHKGYICRIPRLVGNRYEVSGILSSGGFGFIYFAKDRRLFNKSVLIKSNKYGSQYFRFRRDKAVQRIIQEGRDRLQYEKSMLLLGHHRGLGGIPVLLDWLVDDSAQILGPHKGEDGKEFYLEPDAYRNEPYLVMSYVNGKTLKECCDQPFFRTNLLGYSKQIMLQVGRILSGFHSIKNFKGKSWGFVYQDLKPENIVFTYEKQMVLIDFGSFCAFNQDKVHAKFALTSTPPYRPPEFDQNLSLQKQVAPTADVFSLAATLFHVLQAKEPNVDAVGNAIFPIEDLMVPEEWKNWLRKGLDPDPAKRFQTMREVIEQTHNLPAKKEKT